MQAQMKDRSSHFVEITCGHAAIDWLQRWFGTCWQSSISLVAQSRLLLISWRKLWAQNGSFGRTGAWGCCRLAGGLWFWTFPKFPIQQTDANGSLKGSIKKLNFRLSIKHSKWCIFLGQTEYDTQTQWMWRRVSPGLFNTINTTVTYLYYAV